MKEQALTRRALLSRSGYALVAGLIGCKPREFSCSDALKLPEADQKARQAIAYVDRAADTARQCDACQHWQAAPPDACGACAVVRGPIHPLGTCRLFAKRG